jgi:hypothetical protein
MASGPLSDCELAMRRRLLRWILIGLATALVTGLLVGGWFAWTTANYALDAEHTHHAYLFILDLVSVHVERTDGRWPTSWDELAAESPSRDPSDGWKWSQDRERIQQRIHVDFSVTCADVARMNAKNFHAIDQSSPNFGPDEGRIDELLRICRKYQPALTPGPSPVGRARGAGKADGPSTNASNPQSPIPNP